MIDRYTRPEMGRIWSEESKFQTWLEVELAVCEAQSQLGIIPVEAVADIKANARFEISRIKEIEGEVLHDVIAFLTNLAENVGETSRFIHLGLTSSDILDTALALQLRRASQVIKADLQALHDVILEQARRHKHTIMVGRSHGIHAEPITFGFKLAVWLEEIRRHQARLDRALEEVSVGKISGAVGTYANVSPEVESLALRLLGLKAEPVATQVVQRDRHAHYLCTLAVIAASLEKFATEIRHLQRTDVLEAEEPFKQGQKGSSAMPHKRNPVGCENITGLARVVRANALAAMENVALWHERDISHSSVERIVIPDSTILLDFMLDRLTRIVGGLVVYPENMRRNMDIFGGVIFSQSVLLKLVEKGLTREQAYKLVQGSAMEAWNKNDGNFKENLLQDEAVMRVLSRTELEDCFNPAYYLKNVDRVFERIGI